MGTNLIITKYGIIQSHHGFVDYDDDDDDRSIRKYEC